MARPPLLIGTWGNIKRHQVEPGHWYANCRVRDHDGVTRQARRYSPAGVYDKVGAAAERELTKHLATRTHIEGSDAITTDTSVLELWTAYRVELVADKKAHRTLTRYDEVAKFIENGLGGVRLRELTTQRLEAFLRTVEAKNGPGNLKTTRTVLSGMLGMAVRFGAMKSNLVRDTRGAKSTAKKTPRSLTPEQLSKLLVDVRTSKLECPPLQGSKYAVPTVADYCRRADLADPITMFTATGVRMSELLGIAWPDIDFKAKTVALTGKVSRVPGEGMVRTTAELDPKNRHRVLALPDYAISMLRTRKLAAGPSENDVVFPSAKGTLRDPDAFNQQWRRVRKVLELDWVTGHTFRRTVATILDDAKLTARATADQLGHAKVSMTQDKYMSRGTIRHEVAEILESAAAQGL